ncbi:MAG: FtsQ-type POTRA domain-containing protein [Oscillospiraceae bacterium]|nr:FtsQ-type POTRA domain-containing protein [Oscillospiraceae bacterium]
MDTKEKNREEARKRAPEQEQRRKRPAENKTDRKKAAPAKSGKKPALFNIGKKPAAKAAPKTAAKSAPKSAPKRPADPAMRRRPGESIGKARDRMERPDVIPQTRQVVHDDRDTHQSAEIRRPARADSGRMSAPKGTGPRKSAPQMSVRETSELRRQQKNQPKAPEKKTALQNFISGVKGENLSEDAAARAEQRRKERAARAEKKRKQAERNDTPAVIYTQPAAFSRDRLLIQLLTVTAVVAALVLGMSVFFKVKTVTVAGAETYSAWAIREASGISEGDNLLTFSKAKASAKIQASLAYVDDVRIGIKLPDTVIIYIEEMDVAYAIESTQGDWWLINSGGRVVEQITSVEAKNHTQVLGVMLEDPQPGSNAVAANAVPQETLESGEPVPITVSGEQRLSSCLQILKALETNDIVGQAASVDVSDLEDVMLWYGSQYEVLLGNTADMEYKIACMNDAILAMSDYQSGILDVSFTHWKDQVGYTPFG